MGRKMLFGEMKRVLEMDGDDGSIEDIRGADDILLLNVGNHRVAFFSTEINKFCCF